MKHTKNTIKKQEDHHTHMVTIAWKMVLLMEQLSNKIFKLFEDEFAHRLRSHDYHDDSDFNQLTF